MVLYSTGIVEHEYVFAAGSVDAVTADGWQTLAIGDVCDVGSDYERESVVLSSHVHGYSFSVET